MFVNEPHAFYFLLSLGSFRKLLTTNFKSFPSGNTFSAQLIKSNLDNYDYRVLDQSSLDLLDYSSRRHILIRHYACRTLEARCDAALSKRGQARAFSYLEAMGSDS